MFTPSNYSGIALTNPSTLKQGSDGDEVRELHVLLAVAGYGVDYDTDEFKDQEFGSATKRAVRSFQKDQGLDVDGIVGPNTWSALKGWEPAGEETSAEATGLVTTVKDKVSEFRASPVFYPALAATALVIIGSVIILRD